MSATDRAAHAHPLRVARELLLMSRRANAESDAGDTLPPAFRQRLYELFGQIEKEFEALFAHNFALQAKVEELTERLAADSSNAPTDLFDRLGIETLDKPTKQAKRADVGQRLKTALKVPPSANRFVQQFKGGDACRTQFLRCYEGHRDGIWHVDSVNIGDRSWMASASADGTSRIWLLNSTDTSKACIALYNGHGANSSVNCVRFATHDGRRPHIDADNTCIVLTASGDQSAHIWRVPLTTDSSNRQEEEATVGSSDDDLDNDRVEDGDGEHVTTITHPTLRLTGHSGAVVAADWLCTGNQVVTASWDRTAFVYDAERGEIIHMLSGHDQELTYCHAHASQKLVVTASKDTTFRLCDFRESIHSVAVFQGHTDSVNAAVLCANTDKAVSGSDDRTVKVWDLRNMRAALVTLRLDCAINRLSVSHSGIIAIPHDNRQIRLYDLNGTRLARLPRANQRCHRRMVCACAWVEDAAGPVPNLLTCGFDGTVIGWSVRAAQIEAAAKSTADAH